MQLYKYSLLVLLLHMSIYSLCEPLQLPTENIIEVSPGDDIREIVLNANEGSTILFNSGHYKIPQTIYVNQSNITLISKARHRDSVVLDGNMGGSPLDASNFTNEVLALRGSNATIAHLSICHARHHGIHAYPSSSASDKVRNIHLYDLHVFDCGQQLIKVNSNGNTNNLQWVDEGLLECSLIEFQDNSVMQEEPNYFYTGGIDVHGGENWIIRQNWFKNIERESKLMEHAVHFWNKSRGTLVENNYFINTYRAVGFGMKTEENGTIERHYPDGLGDTPYFDHIGGIVRNNVIYNEEGIHLESGVELSNVHDVKVYNNTVISAETPFSSIEYRWPNTTVDLKNNICSHSIKERNSASATAEANLINAPVTLFENPGNYNFHLKDDATTAIGQGVTIPDSLFGVDMDGQKPDTSWEIGADQIVNEAVLTPGNNSTSTRIVCINRKLYVQNPAKEPLQVTLIDLSGKILLCKNIEAKKAIDIPSYIFAKILICIVNSNQKSWTQKIVLP